MEPINCFEHHQANYYLKVELQNNTLFFFLTCQPNLHKWKAIFTFDQLPTILTSIHSTLKDVLCLFADPDNFIVEN